MGKKIALTGSENSRTALYFQELTHDPGTDVVLLPETSSLSSLSPEGETVRRFLLEERPGGILCMIAADRFRQGLYLALELLETCIPMTLILEQTGEGAEIGGKEVLKLSEMLGIPVILMGERDLPSERMREALRLVKEGKKPNVSRLPEDLTDLVDAIADVLGGMNSGENRWLAVNLLAKDELAGQRIQDDEDTKWAVDELRRAADKMAGGDVKAWIAEALGGYLEQVISSCVRKGNLRNRR